MTHSTIACLRASLVFVWLATAMVSVLELHGQSRELLDGVPTPWLATMPWLATATILAGAGVDAILGLWLAFRPGRMVYWAALVMMGLMTVLATAIHPQWWLHPLGPLTKNLPIAAILWVLLQEHRASASMKKAS